jgi:16S rRNA (guanine527-N7)-methyltransferase
MELEEFRRELNKQLSKFDINIEEKESDILYYYMKEIIKWNEKINVTAITDEKEFLIKHIVDSLLMNKYIKGKESIIDVGTGGGFPGIPIAVTNNVKVALMDAVNKKLNVIRSISEELKINNIDIIHSRAEDMGQDKAYREKYEICTSRAVASLPTLLEYMLPLTKVGGKVICMKGPSFDIELENAKKAISVLGGELEKVDNYILEGNNERNIVVIKKVKNTPKNYPRKNGKPNKEPIL